MNSTIMFGSGVSVAPLEAWGGSAEAEPVTALVVAVGLFACSVGPLIGSAILLGGNALALGASEEIAIIDMICVKLRTMEPLAQPKCSQIASISYLKCLRIYSE